MEEEITMGKGYTKYRSCKVKTKYQKHDAESNLRTKNRRMRKELHVYKCDFCEFYHIGHKRKSDSKSLKASKALKKNINRINH